MNGTLVKETRMRAGIARRMVRSKQEAPHFYVQTEVLVDRVESRLAQLNERAGEPRMSMTTALVRGCVAALSTHRRFNCVWTKEGLLEADEINLGIAIALDDGGLVAPALLNTDKLDARGTTEGLRELATRARSQRLRPEELVNATFTLSNLGMFDVTAFTAIITPPQVGILATARPVERVVIRNGQATHVAALTATLSADHRAVDGADAARFLETFKQALEDEDSLLPMPADLRGAKS